LKFGVAALAIFDAKISFLCDLRAKASE